MNYKGFDMKSQGALSQWESAPIFELTSLCAPFILRYGDLLITYSGRTGEEEVLIDDRTW